MRSIKELKVPPGGFRRGFAGELQHVILSKLSGMNENNCLNLKLKDSE